MTAEPRDREPPQGATRGLKTPGLVLAGITLLALALRLLDLTRFELWIDEAATWWYARLIAEGRILEGVRLEPTPPLYYALVAAMGGLFGWSDFVLRLPSVIFGTLSVPALYLLVRRLVGRGRQGPERALACRAGLFAAALLAVHPLHVFYSREARVYPLLLLLAMLLWWAIRRAQDLEATSDDRAFSSPFSSPARIWAPVVVLLVVAAYCHYYGLFLFATAGVLVLAGGHDMAARRRGVLAVALAALAFLPYVIHTLPSLRQSGAAWSVEVLYQLFPGDRSFLRVLEMEAIGARYPAYLRELSRPVTAGFVRWPALLAQVVLGLVGLVAWARSSPRRASFLLAAWLLPVALPWAITHTFRPIFHPGRHDVYGLWGVLAVAGLGWAWLTRPRPRRRPRHRPMRRRATAALAVVCLLSILFAAGLRIAALHNIPAAQDARRTGAFLAEHLGDGDRVVTLANRRLRAERYLRLALESRLGEVEISVRSFPAELDQHPGWADPRELNERLPLLRAEAEERVETFAEEGVERVFLLPTHPPPQPGERPPAFVPVDATFFRALERAGWQPVPALTDRDLVIFTYRRPRGIGGA